MSTLRDKAIASWEIAEELRDDEAKINWVANRYYYALFQAAWWRNEQSPMPLAQRGDEGTHQFAKRIVDTLSHEIKQKRIFSTFKGLRITADYKPIDVKTFQLKAYDIGTAFDLLTELIGSGDKT